MSQLTSEAKAAVRANLELELKAREEKLVAMCEAQVASLRSRLERRVNRIPTSKRSVSLVELLDPSVSTSAKVVKASPAKKEAATALAPVPVRNVTQPAGRKTKTAPTKAVSKPAPKTNTRGKKRPSDDGDKENEELSIPKKRVKATAKAAQPAPAPVPAARSTRAASKKVAPSGTTQVLSPKPNNSRPATRTRRAR